MEYIDVVSAHFGRARIWYCGQYMAISECILETSGIRITDWYLLSGCRTPFEFNQLLSS